MTPTTQLETMLAERIDIVAIEVMQDIIDRMDVTRRHQTVSYCVDIDGLTVCGSAQVECETSATIDEDPKFALSLDGVDVLNLTIEEACTDSMIDDEWHDDFLAEYEEKLLAAVNAEYECAI